VEEPRQTFDGVVYTDGKMLPAAWVPRSHSQKVTGSDHIGGLPTRPLHFPLKRIEFSKMKLGEAGLVAILLAVAFAGARCQSSDQDTVQATAPSEERISSASPSNFAESDQPALEIRSRVAAVYPREAREMNLQGRVLIKLQVSESGDVEAVELVSGPTAFVHAAREAAKQWKFKPIIKNGRPIKFSTTIPFEFRLNGQVPDWGTRAPETTHRPTPAGQGVIQGKLIQRVPPAYPARAKFLHLRGPVLLDATVGKDGTIQFLHVIQGHPVLAQAAMDAVRQWRYTPYTLDGEPIDVNMQILLNFSPSEFIHTPTADR
jgi:TonB family protein